MFGRTAKSLPLLYTSLEGNKFRLLQTLSLGTSALLTVGTPMVSFFSTSPVPIGIKGLIVGIAMSTGIGTGYANHLISRVFVQEVRGNSEVFEFSRLNWRNQIVTDVVPVKDLKSREMPLYLLVDSRNENKFFIPELEVVKMIEDKVLPVELLPEKFEEVQEDPKDD